MESKSGQDNMALKDMNIPTATEAQQLARDRALEKQEQLCELSRALAVLASASVRICCLKAFSCHNMANFFSLSIVQNHIIKADS